MEGERMAKHSDIMKQVFAHMWGLVVVDHQSRIVFIEEKYAGHRRGFFLSGRRGRQVRFGATRICGARLCDRPYRCLEDTNTGQQERF